MLVTKFAQVVAPLFFGAAVFSVSAAEMYRTVDSKGHPVFTDHPLNAKSEKITVQVKQPDADGAANAASQQANADAEALRRERQRALDEKAQAERADRERKQKQYCAYAKQRYQTFADGGLLYSRDENGQRVFYSADQIEAERAKSRAALDEYCSD